MQLKTLSLLVTISYFALPSWGSDDDFFGFESGEETSQGHLSVTEEITLDDLFGAENPQTELTVNDLFGGESSEEIASQPSISVVPEAITPENLSNLSASEELLEDITENNRTFSLQEKIDAAITKAETEGVTGVNLLTAVAKGDFDFTPEMARAYIGPIMANKANPLHIRAWTKFTLALDASRYTLFSDSTPLQIYGYLQEIADYEGHPFRSDAQEKLIHAASKQLFGFDKESGKLYLQEIADNPQHPYQKQAQRRLKRF